MSEPPGVDVCQEVNGNWEGISRRGVQLARLEKEEIPALRLVGGREAPGQACKASWGKDACWLSPCTFMAQRVRGEGLRWLGPLPDGLPTMRVHRGSRRQAGIRVTGWVSPGCPVSKTAKQKRRKNQGKHGCISNLGCGSLPPIALQPHALQQKQWLA